MNSIEQVQRRPGMYVGPTDDGTGLHNLVYEVVGNAINEALAGYATEIFVRLNADGSCTVRDNGRGIPIDIHPRFGMSAAEVVMTQLHAGGMFDHDKRNVASHLGVGVCVVNALSEWLDLRIWRDGNEHRARFKQGETEAPLKTVGGATGKHGTEVTFLPSASVFTSTAFNSTKLEARLRDFATIEPAATIQFVDARRPTHDPLA